jgi:Zn-dependent M32 family carboxypeptidase
MMTVSYSGVSQTVRAEDVLYSREAAVRAIAQAAMINMAEANAEMMMDCPEEYSTRADAERVFQGLHEQARDFVNDVFSDLETSVLKELERAYTARVTALHFDDRGELADVDVKVVFE